MESLVSNAILFLLLLGGALFVRKGRKRDAKDVLLDLSDGEMELEQGEIALGTNRLTFGDDISAMGLFENEERAVFLKKQRLRPFIFAAILLLIKISALSSDLGTSFVTVGVGFCMGYLSSQRRIRTAQERYKRELEYFLPVVMERVVMAAEAGLDIFAALSSLVELEEQSAKWEERDVDPVTRLISIVTRLTEAGMGFDDALHEVANAIPCSALRHAFIHLALAHQEGGELVMPIRELSDATQLYFQETIEEEVAKLPVKATMPLVLTFAGLIILFITAPLVEVMRITSEAIGG